MPSPAEFNSDAADHIMLAVAHLPALDQAVTIAGALLAASPSTDAARLLLNAVAEIAAAELEEMMG